MLYYIFLIHLIIFCTFLIKYNNVNKANSNWQFDEVYLINLKRRPDRLQQFMQKFNASDLKHNNILKFNAIDGSILDTEKIFISDVAKAEIKQIETTGFRTKHYQLTRGAIGCYLSHIQVWEHILDSKHNAVIIFEDDANVPVDIKQTIQENMRHIPENWDIVLFGFYCKDCIPGYKHNKVNRFILLHCYAINRNAVLKILKSNTLFPITQQIDSLISELSNILNIYSFEKNTVSQFGSRTDIQLPIYPNSKNSHERLLVSNKDVYKKKT